MPLLTPVLSLHLGARSLNRRLQPDAGGLLPSKAS